MNNKYDIVVLGGGISGFHAAIASSRMGLNTLLIEKTSSLGGMATNGLVNPYMKYWIDEEYLVGNIFEELNKKIDDLGGSFENTFDSELMKVAMNKMVLNEKNLTVLFNTILEDVFISNNKIENILLRHNNGEKININAKFFIDCSGDSVLGLKSKCDLLIGNDSKENQAVTTMFVIGGVDFEKIRNDVKQNKENFLAWVGYEMKVISVAGYFKEINQARKDGMDLPNDLFFYVQLPHGNRVSVNSMDLSHNSINPSDLSKSTLNGTIYAYNIYSFAKKYVKGFENSYLEKIAPEIGIRESRRIIGKYIFKKEDVLEYKKFKDGIVKGCYGVDIHKKDKKIDEKEKKFVPIYNDFYEIPLRSLLSKDIENLGMAGKTFSSDFESHSAARIQPTCADMGQKVAVAIGIHLKENKKFEYISKDEIINNLNSISNL
ncbi:FAD dependent oxidoreductase [Oceanotoga teriensis]|jgi:hypothetical protein|uniref:FAD dependent oxidoreductase n=1 Tax=Oceanotoga teriensis TaxID=515440 RepID=A0AA45C4Y8_9BACT|nr:FAD-dependent oxidoreductase [Oceanotoga teriensis]PWJ87702.1 FAD dependent oxidoreductase [Oceanotoga teriensis]